MTISHAYDPELWCPECERGIQASAWVIVDSREQPDAWAKCRNDTIHCFRCAANHPQRIQAPLLLYDSGAPGLYYSQAPMASPEQAQQEFTALIGKAWNALSDATPQAIERMLKIVRRELLPLAMAGLDEHTIGEVEAIYQLTSVPLTDGEAHDRLEAIQYALDLFAREDAPMLWSTFTSRLAECVTRGNVGDPAQNLDDGMRITELVLAELRTHDEPLRLAIAEMNLGVQYGRLPGTAENRRTALELLSRAHRVFRPRLFPQYCSVACNNLAIQYMKGSLSDRAADTESAIEALLEGIAAIVPGQDPKLRGELHQHLGIAYFRRVRGDAAENIERSIEAYEQALRTRTQTHAPHEWVLSRMDLGNALLIRVKGDPAENIDRAIHTYQTAADFARQNGFAFDWARLQYDLAHAYLLRIRGRGDENAEKAIAAGNAALQVIGRDSHPDDWSNIQQNLGNAYRELARSGRTELWNKSVEAYRQALSVRSPEKSRADWLATLDNLAGTYAERGGGGQDLEDLTVQIEEAVAQGQGDVPPRLWAAFLVNLGTAWRDRRTGDPAENQHRAVEAFSAAIDISTRFGMYEHLRRAVLRLALLRQWAGEWEQSYVELSAARAALEQVYTEAVSEEGKETTADSNWFLYQRLAQACLSTGRLREAFLYTEEGNARVLRDELARLPIPVAGLPQSLAAEESELLERLRAADLALRRTDRPEPRSALIVELQAIRDGLGRVWEEMLRTPEAVGYVKARRGDPLRWEDVQAWLSRQSAPAALVEFAEVTWEGVQELVTRRTSVAELAQSTEAMKRLVAFVVRPGEAEPRVVHLDLPQSDLLSLIVAWTDELHAPNDGEGTPAKELGRRLLAPITPHLAGVSRICVVPQGLLHNIPIHALPVDGQFLIDRVAVQYAPSASAAMQQRPGFTESALSSMAVAGNPAGDLPFAEFEAAAVARRFQCEALLRHNAGLESVVDALSAAEAAHIAAHAWFDQRDPLASGILLASGQVLDARRAMHEKLQLRLLVLSACSTGQQSVRVSNSVSGLARAFLYAGVRQLILSLWPVNDLSTMLLMDRFYEALGQGLSVGEALRAAQVGLRTATNAAIARRFAEDRKRAPDDRLLDEATVSDLWRRFALAEPDVRPFEHAHYWAPFFVTGGL